MKLSLPLPQNSIETLLPEVLLFKLAFWQACMKMSALKRKNRPSGSNQSCVACLASIICTPNGLKLNPDACYLATPQSHPILLIGFQQRHSGLPLWQQIHLSCMSLLMWKFIKTIWPYLRSVRNLTKTVTWVWTETERTVRNYAYSRMGILTNVWCKCNISKGKLNHYLLMCVSAEVVFS